MYSATQKRMMKHIIQTTYYLLKEVDFRQMTIQIICDKAEINRSTFYRYFEDKYDLLQHVIEYIAEILYENTQDSQYNTIFEALIYYVESNENLFKNVLTSDRQVDLFSELVKMSSKIFLELSQNFNDQLSINIRSAKHPELLSDFYSSGIIEVLKKWMEKKYKYSSKQLVNALNEGLL